MSWLGQVQGPQGLRGQGKDSFAAQLAAEAAAKTAMEHGMRQIEVLVKGPGSGERRLLEHFRLQGSK